MYLRHFALTRLPFETPAHTDELFDSNSRREAETRLNHLIRTARHRLAHRASSRSERHFQVRSAQEKPPCADTSPPCVGGCVKAQLFGEQPS